jgi:formyltetrahydrofolate deformylase
MAIFVSKEGHCLWDILARYQSEEWNVEIPLIISNHEKFASVARQFGIAFHLFPISAANKPEQERKELDLLEKLNADFVVLARYMQILSDEFVTRCKNPIINIHHSFLPAFAGAKPYHQAYERGVKLIGATAHYVTSVLDEGPIIEQDIVRVSHRDSVSDMIRRGRDLEKVVLSRAIFLHLNRQVIVHGNRTVVFT